MRYWVGGAFAFFLALVQASSVEQFHVLGVVPNLMLVLLVCWLVVRGLDDVLPMVAVAGVTAGFIGLQTAGVALLALLLAITATGAFRELHVIHSETALVFALVAVASLIYESLLLLSVIATGGPLDVDRGIREAVIPAAALNLIITPPVFLAMRFARPAPRRAYA